MSVLLYLLVFTCVLLLPFLSFLRRGAIFRGGSNPEGFLHSTRSAVVPPVSRARRARQNAVRLVFLMCLLLPANYVIWLKLFQLERVRDSLSLLSHDATAAELRSIINCADRDNAHECIDGQTPNGGRGPVGLLTWAIAQARKAAARQRGERHRGRLNRILSRVDDLFQGEGRLRDGMRLARRLALWCPRQLGRLLYWFDARVTRVLLFVPMLPSSLGFLELAAVVDVLYAYYFYLDHREEDPELRRHNTSRLAAAINWFKYKFARRMLLFNSTCVKRYFSLELVAAYGPLPMFVFPTEANLQLLRQVRPSPARQSPPHATSTDGDEQDGGSDEHKRRHADDDWDADELAQLQRQQRREGRTTGAEPFTPFAREVTGVFSATRAAAATTPGAHPSLTHSASSLPHRAPSTVPSSDSDEAPRSIGTPDVDDVAPLMQSTSVMTRAHRSTPDSVEDAVLRPDMPYPTRSSSASALSSPSLTSDSFAALLATPAQTEPTAPPAVLECTHYFFAAHPHGILPACGITSLLSDVMGRNKTLFVDNRGFSSDLDRPTTAATSPNAHSPVDFPAGLSTHSSSPLFTASSPGVSPQCAPLPSPAAPSVAAAGGRAFTITNTRDMKGPSPMHTPAADALPSVSAARLAVFGRGAASGATSPAESSHSLPESALPAAPLPPARYAKARYYVYNKDLERFILQESKDEAVPPVGCAAIAHPTPSVGTFRSRLRAVVATFPFYIPIMRELYMVSGLLDASYDTCKRVLLYNNKVLRDTINRCRTPVPPKSEPHTGTANDEDGHAARAAVAESSSNNDDGDDDDTPGKDKSFPRDLNHLLLFPGGASEALLSSSRGPTRILLRRRRGFLRLVLQTNSGLVPVFTFGETDYLDQYGTTSSRFAAPLEDDDSIYSQQGPPVGASEDRGATDTDADDAPRRASTQGQLRAADERKDSNSGRATAPGLLSRLAGGGSGTLFSRFTASRVPGESYYQAAIPSSADDEPSFSLSASRASPTSSVGHRFPTARLTVGDRVAASARQQRSPSPPSARSTHASPTAAAKVSAAPRKRWWGRWTARPRPPRATPPSLRAGSDATTADGTRAPAENRRGAARGERLPKWLQLIQRVFQQTFGISLPFLRNVFPKRVRAKTVVGRPIYFLLPPALQQMYDEPEKYYDKEKERPILIAAQEVYIRELRDLFNLYAPSYYKDHSRRKLIVI